jgi:hypothetical protein
MAPVLLSITRCWQVEPCRINWIVPVAYRSLAPRLRVMKKAPAIAEAKITPPPTITLSMNPREWALIAPPPIEVA